MSREAYKRDWYSEKDRTSLPAGKTCGDCKHFDECYVMIGRISVDEVCDWVPSKFQERLM